MTSEALASVLMTRRSVHQFRPDPIDPMLVRRWLEYAVFVPNHHLTEPWRFVVVTGEAKDRLADIRAQQTLAKHAGKPHAERAAENARREYREVPMILAVIQRLDPDPVRREEDYAACACAAYTFMLAAWADGVGTYWGTGAVSRAPETRDLLRLAEDERVVALIRVGYPDRVPAARRHPAAEKTLWLS
jgi:nitroreductase